MEKVTVMESAELEEMHRRVWGELPVSGSSTGTSCQEIEHLRKLDSTQRSWNNAHEMTSVQKGKATWKNRKQVAHFQRTVYMFI